MTIPANSKKSKSKKKAGTSLSALDQLKQTMKAEIDVPATKPALKQATQAAKPPVKESVKQSAPAQAKRPSPPQQKAETAKPKAPPAAPVAKQATPPPASPKPAAGPALPALKPSLATTPNKIEPMTQEIATKGASPAMNTMENIDWTGLILHLAERTHKVLKEFMEKSESMPSNYDPAHLTEAFTEMAERLAKSPEKVVDTHIAFMQDYVRLLQATLARAAGQPAETVIEPEKGDKRFKDPAWEEIWFFDYIKQSYLLMSRWVQSLVKKADGLDPRILRKVDFYARQMVDAMSPANFWMTNPEVLRVTQETHGENLIKGLEHLLNDIERGHGQLMISMTSPNAFQFGDNIAVTPGKVVFQNELFQLLQYSPATETVHKTPLLIVPPWINKYYILDLGKKNSFIRYLVDQGHTVFCMSWVNPDQRHAKIQFEDYMMLGPVTALREVGNITGEKAVNLIGYCIGGTLTATMLAWLKANGKNPIPGGPVPEVASVTFLTTMVDFTDPGDVIVFIDEEQVEILEGMMAEHGYLPAPMMSTAFNMLRANDLIWSFVINNYLLGREPFPFDLLSWNADSTNLPAAMQSFYLRNMYMENNLVKPGKVVVKDVPIDLTNVTVPVCFVSAREDHIAPWKTTYTATQIFKGPINFILSGSGHIAGIINPPDKKKYGYWTHEGACPAKPDDWFKKAVQHEGSWWPEWANWIKQHAGEMIPPRTPGEGATIIEDAPGSYVRKRVM
jgi:polyhydroxyalkanoate synthase